MSSLNLRLSSEEKCVPVIIESFELRFFIKISAVNLGIVAKREGYRTDCYDQTIVLDIKTCNKLQSAERAGSF